MRTEPSSRRLLQRVMPGALFAALTLWAVPATAQLADVEDTSTIIEDAEAMSADEGAAVDPWEGFNRRIFAFNNAVDEVFLVPAAQLYRAVTFNKQRRGIRNFLDNLRTPQILLNDILQGEFKRARNTASRFVINSTVGFGGMGDPAERIGIAQHSEDFGQTLAVWGAPAGPYLVIPIFGPSTIRDGIGAAGGVAMDPAVWLRTDAAALFRYTRAGVTGVAVREPLIEPLEEIKANSLDQYASFRSFYLQARKREIQNGRTDFEDLPDIGDFDEFEDLE
ncbi:MAG: VacJ family lipoprotein [Pseudomonadota bacterium]